MPWLVLNTAVELPVGVGLGSGGRPTSKRLPAVSFEASSAYLHGPSVFFAVRAAIGLGLRLGSGAPVELGEALADGECWPPGRRWRLVLVTASARS